MGDIFLPRIDPGQVVNNKNISQVSNKPKDEGTEKVAKGPTGSDLIKDAALSAGLFVAGALTPIPGDEVAAGVKLLHSGAKVYKYLRWLILGGSAAAATGCGTEGRLDPIVTVKMPYDISNKIDASRGKQVITISGSFEYYGTKDDDIFLLLHTSAYMIKIDKNGNYVWDPTNAHPELRAPYGGLSGAFIAGYKAFDSKGNQVYTDAADGTGPTFVKERVTTPAGLEIIQDSATGLYLVRGEITIMETIEIEEEGEIITVEVFTTKLVHYRVDINGNYLDENGQIVDIVNPDDPETLYNSDVQKIYEFEVTQEYVEGRVVLIDPNGDRVVEGEDAAGNMVYYQVDENGEYVLDENFNYIALYTFTQPSAYYLVKVNADGSVVYVDGNGDEVPEENKVAYTPAKDVFGNDILYEVSCTDLQTVLGPIRYKLNGDGLETNMPIMRIMDSDYEEETGQYALKKQKTENGNIVYKYYLCDIDGNYVDQNGDPVGAENRVGVDPATPMLYIDSNIDPNNPKNRLDMRIKSVRFIWQQTQQGNLVGGALYDTDLSTSTRYIVDVSDPDTYRFSIPKGLFADGQLNFTMEIKIEVDPSVLDTQAAILRAPLIIGYQAIPPGG